MPTPPHKGRGYSAAPEIALHNGDCMTQREFHGAYLAMPDDYRAELIGGVVFEPSPVGSPHASSAVDLTLLIGTYARKTPGLDCGQNATVILSKKDEVQPDLLLRIKPQFGGQTENQPGSVEGIYYVKGAPELVAEVSHSSYAIDLHLKRRRFARFGVLEYIVLCLDPSRIYWFEFRAGNDAQSFETGILKSAVFPGLWIDTKALLESDFDRSMEVLGEGMNSREYKEFVEKLSKNIRY